MRNKQVRVEHAAVQVDARTRGDAAASAFFRVKCREPQIEIVIVPTDLVVGNPQLAESAPAERLEPIVPGQREVLGMIRHVGRDRLAGCVDSDAGRWAGWTWPASFFPAKMIGAKIWFQMPMA